jgi:hypothetical protein
MAKPEISVKTGVNPYPDGSGYAVDIHVFWEAELDRIVIDIKPVGYLEGNEWPGVVRAVEKALAYIEDARP